MESGPQPLVVVVGPTAAGKSTLAEALATALGGEVVSADALQLYRGLDIGTAKPSLRVRDRIRYHCVDVLAATERCSAGEYARLARAAVNDARNRGALPILAGGSGFYLQAALSGLHPLPRSDASWRSVLETLLDRHGPERLHGMLTRLDRGWAEHIGPRDGQRVLRALEVVLRTGRKREALVGGETAALPGSESAAWVGITWPRAELWARIERRVDDMLAAGWVDEVRGLLRAGVPAGAHALQAIGYREIVEHVEGRVSLADTRERIVIATRRYAKRQLTWFRGVPGVRWWRLSNDGAGPSSERARSEIEAEIRSRCRC